MVVKSWLLSWNSAYIDIPELTDEIIGSTAIFKEL
jgi:hypothetical protein